VRSETCRVCRGPGLNTNETLTDPLFRRKSSRHPFTRSVLIQAGGGCEVHIFPTAGFPAHSYTLTLPAVKFGRAGADSRGKASVVTPMPGKVVKVRRIYSVCDVTSTRAFS
jgi:hypothetical protein